MKLVCGWMFFICLYTKAQEPGALEWQLVKDKNDIKVYTATSPASPLKYIKVDALLHGTLKKFVDVFKDVPGQSKWVYNTKNSYVIKKTDDDDFLYYNETTLPWPMSNRDVIIHMKIAEDNTHQEVTITSMGESNAIPVNNKIVRVPHFIGNWKVRDAGNGQLQVSYFLDIDPGGTIPAWIVNMFVTKGPYETFIGLANKLNS